MKGKNKQNMKIVLIGPGILSIPPTNGWGAVESLTWDLAQFFEHKCNSQVLIVNTPNKREIIDQTNAYTPDVVHCQYDEHVDVMPLLTCKVKIITSHYAYLEHHNFKDSGSYAKLFDQFVEGSKSKQFYIFALSQGIANKYIQRGACWVKVLPNGANADVFRFESNVPKFNQRSIYLAKIEPRKRQHVYQNIQSLWFAGNNICKQFNAQNPRYMGEWTKQTLYNNLTDYANLVLLSDGEAHPLVCCEALICGLGLVLSSYAAANLDLTLPWITVIPDNKLDDVAFIENAIIANREASLVNRIKIRQYGLDQFSWSKRAMDIFQSYELLLK